MYYVGIHVWGCMHLFMYVIPVCRSLVASLPAPPVAAAVLTPSVYELMSCVGLCSAKSNNGKMILTGWLAGRLPLLPPTLSMSIQTRSIWKMCNLAVTGVKVVLRWLINSLFLSIYTSASQVEWLNVLCGRKLYNHLLPKYTPRRCGWKKRASLSPMVVEFFGTDLWGSVCWLMLHYLVG